MECDSCKSDRIVEIESSDRGASMELVNKKVSVEYSNFEVFKLCLNCGKMQGTFPYEKLDLEKAIEEVSTMTKSDLEEDQYNEFSHIIGIKKYAKPDQFVFHLEEHEGKGFAVINKLKNFSGTYKIDQNVYPSKFDSENSLKQLKPALFVTLSNGEIQNGKVLKQKLVKLGFKNIQQEESIFKA